MRIAIASSGLGHVARGIETWALDTACALAGRGCDVTLFCAGAVDAVSARVDVLPALRRGDARAVRLAARSPGWSWRWQLKNPYGWEQLSFWRLLWPRLRRGRFDILHVQDPMLAYWCRLFRKLGLVRTKEILAHGTEETPSFLGKFEYVQHLAPWHLRNSEPGTRNSEPMGEDGKCEARNRRQGNVRRRWRQLSSAFHAPRSASGGWVAIPNFVDTAVFRPAADDAERRAGRAAFGLPPDARIVGSVAALKKPHKRVDHLIREFAAASMVGPAVLVVAGARTGETAELEALGRQLAPGRVFLLGDIPRERMPALYRCFDVFVLASLFEMMPIAVLEALASGLPVRVHRHPVLEWMIGASGPDSGADTAGGESLDMATAGTLAAHLAALDRADLAAQAARARRRAVDVFGRDRVSARYLDYYRRVAGEATASSPSVVP